MNRNIITLREIDRATTTRARGAAAAGRDAATPAAPPSAEPDAYKDRLLKLIPAEVVAVYLALQGILATADGTSRASILLWVISAILLVSTPSYLWRISGVRKRSQLALSTAAFVVWVFALGGPFETLSWYEPLYGALLLPLFTFLVPLFTPQA